MATVRQDGDTFTRDSREHTHQPCPGASTAAKVCRDVKLTAQQNLFTPAGSIVNDVLLEHVGEAPITAVTKPVNLARQANRHRQKDRPKHPLNLNFTVNVDHIPPGFFKQDIIVNDARHLIFSTNTQLHLLTSAKVWYMDGTFKVIREPFTQLFSVHAFLKWDKNFKQEPLLFVIMSSRKCRDYHAFFLEIRKLLPTEIRLQKIVCDFEKAVWRALRKTTVADAYPDFELQGCLFHWTQAIWRKVQSLGMSSASPN